MVNKNCSKNKCYCFKINIYRTWLPLCFNTRDNYKVRYKFLFKVECQHQTPFGYLNKKGPYMIIGTGIIRR